MISIAMKYSNTAIIVLSYNKIRQTKECIDSIILSGYDCKNIFCFDNGSKREVFDELKMLYPDINFKRIEQNRGYSGGFNESMKWVFSLGYNASLFLTNDTRIFSDTLFEILRTAEQTDAGIIAPSIYYLLKSDIIDSTGGYFDPQKGSLYHYKDINASLILDRKMDYIPGTALWIKKPVFEILNGIDESYHTYWEDVDLSFRARKKGIILARSKNAKILHAVGKTCHKKPEYTTYYFQRNRIKFCKTHLKGEILNKCLLAIEQDLLEIKQKLEIKKDTRRLDYINKVLIKLNT